MRWDSPIVLVIAGTLAIHTLLLTFVDAIVVTHPPKPPDPAPRITMVDITPPPPPVLKPPPPPVEPVKPDLAPPPVVKDTPRPRVRTTQRVQDTPPPPPTTEPPPPSSTPSNDPGGSPTLAMPDIGPGTTGVGVRVGPRTTGKIGRGGSGGGTGAGSGTGTGDVPAPVSVATIKTRAMPRGDYGYIDAGKDYPAEARQLGIEGAIRVRLVVDDQGKVKSAVLLNKLGHGLDELALERAKKIEFDPARDTDDKAVSSVVVWTFNMTLPKS
ncbi:MAG TPA: TonB family protein [Kofleriaceae bacterium]|nr:TonB family protein [Kofleriaceae bacterium]